jgi:hypothetical protein
VLYALTMIIFTTYFIFSGIPELVEAGLGGHVNNTCHFRGEGGGVAKVSPNITMGEGGLAKMSRDKFSLVISLVKVNKSLCHVTQGGGGRGKKKCHQVSHRGRSKNCGKCVTYYFNGP